MTKNNNKDVLTRPWWPGQWLRIVWSVWVDQIWYWENIRPRLYGRKQGWDLFIQSLLGTILITLLLLLVAIVFVTAVGDTVRGLALLWISLLPFLMIAAVVGSLTFGLDKGILSAVLFPLVILILFIKDQYLYEGVLNSWIGLVLLCSTIGLAVGIAIGIYRGNITLDDLLIPAIILVFAFSETAKTNVAEPWNYVLNVAKYITPFLFGGLCVYIGGRWATRQIPDVEIRQQLANPDRK